MKDYPRKALMIIWLTYFAFAIFQLFSNDAMVFPSPINTLVILGITVYSTYQEFKEALKFERLGLLMFLFAAVVMFLSDSFIMSIFLNHEIVNEWFSSIALLLAQNMALLALLSSLLIVGYHLSKIRRQYGFLFVFSFLSLTILGFLDVNFEALFVQIFVGLLCLVLAISHRQQISNGTNALLYLWVIQVSIACFEYWNLNL